MAQRLTMAGRLGHLGAFGRLEPDLSALANQVPIKPGRRPERGSTRVLSGRVVSMPLVGDQKPTSPASSPRVASIRCAMERPNRSSFQAIRPSLRRRWAGASASPGRSVFGPEGLVLEHPLVAGRG